jgi:carbamoylphosphate synthase small subunit
MQEVLNLVNVIKTDIANLSKKVEEMSKTHTQLLTEEWIAKEKVLAILKISPRKLQTMRDNGALPFSQIDGKIYYRTSDVELLLKQNYNKR